MKHLAFTLAMFALACTDAMPTERMDSGHAEPDSEVPYDGGVVLDASPDSSIDTPDAGDDDAGGAEDASIDAETQDASTCAGARDDVTGRCYVRFSWVSGPPCPAPYTGLTWSSIEEQQRLMTLLAPLGSAGTSYKRNGATGVWQMPDGSTPGADWAPNHPKPLETFSYLTTEGLKSYHRAYSWQYCTRSES